MTQMFPISALRAVSVLLAALVVAARPGWAAGAGELSVRAIAASAGPPSIDAALKDLEPMLRRHLNFSRFQLMGRATVPLPAQGAPVRVAGDTVVRCTGGAERLSLTIEQRGRVVVQTQVLLRPGAPLVFSGLSEKGGTLLIAVQMR